MTAHDPGGHFGTGTLVVGGASALSVIFHFPLAWVSGLPCAPIPATLKTPPLGSLGELKWDGASG
jgi:hypothetical protein